MTDAPPNPSGGAVPIENRWARTVRTDSRRAALIGYLALILFGAAFIYWAATAPLSGAAIANGVVAAAGQNQFVQHLEGGIIREIHVREGDRVLAADPLFEMDSTQPKANVNALTSKWVSLTARKFRLEAQRDTALQIRFDPDFVEQAARYGLTAVLDEQADEYGARLARYNSEIVILTQRVESAEQAIGGYESQLNALRAQLDVVEEEGDRKKALLDKGLTNRSEYTALLRTQAELVGQIGAITAQMEQSRARIIEAKEQLVRQESQWVEAALTELGEVNARISELEEQLDAARDVLERLVVRAPSDGIVVRIFHNTPGSVVRPGDQMAELLPTSSELIVEARLDAGDIDLVAIGQIADLRLVALNTRTTPDIPGTVIFVSPDRYVDQSTRESFFIARLRIADDLPPEIQREQIYPGMPVEVFISTGERTFLEYLVKPISDSFSRAFREP